MKLTLNFDKSKYLIIRLSSIGDIIISTPICKAIKEANPKAEITFAVNTAFADIIENNPYIDNIIYYNREKSQLKKQKEEIISKYGKFDCVIDLQNNKRSRHLRKGLSEDIRFIEKRRLYKLCLVYLKKQIAPTLHATDNYFNCCEDLINSRNYDSYVNIDTNIRLSDYISNSNKTIAIAPGAAHFTKKLSIDKICEVINELKEHNFVILGGKEDISAGEEIIRRTDAKVINLCGKLKLSGTASIIKQCDCLLCNDSGLMHIASACRKPIVAIFASTVKELGFTPLYNNYTLIENTNVHCRPCSHIGKDKCPKGHFNCMNTLNVKHIVSAISTKL